MPTANFVGTIDTCDVLQPGADQLSLTFGLVPGNRAWSLRNGLGSGETQISSVSENGLATLNHPVDAYYETSTVEGWPFFVCEVWDKSLVGVKSFCGCGSAWLPMSPGEHYVDVLLWKPSPTGLDAIAEALLPGTVDVRALRELIVSPYLRSQVSTDSIGSVRLRVNVTLSGFEGFGVSL